MAKNNCVTLNHSVIPSRTEGDSREDSSKQDEGDTEHKRSREGMEPPLVRRSIGRDHEDDDKQTENGDRNDCREDESGGIAHNT